MKKLFSILFLSCIIIGCKTKDDTPKTNSQVDSEKIINLNLMSSNKNIEVTIKMDSNSLEIGEDIMIHLEVKNLNSKTVKLLFNNPSSSFGPWATTGTLIDIKTNESKLKHANKASLQSQIYSEEDLKELYSYLKPGESISGKFNLTDIVSLNNYDRVLDTGEYRFQLSYYSVSSNELEFIVK